MTCTATTAFHRDSLVDAASCVSRSKTFASTGGQTAVILDSDVLFISECILFFPVGKPSGYDRVRNAEIGNKVRCLCYFTVIDHGLSLIYM